MNTADRTDHPGVIAWPPLIFLICAAVGFLLHRVLKVRLLDQNSSTTIGALVGAFAGVLAFWAMRVMNAAGTNVRPDRPALTVVRTGPYRFTRNPMYLALCLLQLAIGFLLDDAIPMLMMIPLALILHFGVILREERYLEAKFGAQYLALKREVGRWI